MVLSLRNISTVNQSLLQDLSDKVFTTSEVVEVMNSNVAFISEVNFALVDSLNSMKTEFSNTINEFDSQVSNIDELFDRHDKNDLRVTIVEENASLNLAFTERNSNAIEENKIQLRAGIRSNLEFIRRVNDNVNSNAFYTNRRLCSTDLRIISVEDRVSVNSTSIDVLQHNVGSNLRFAERNSNAIFKNRDLIEELNSKFDLQIDTSVNDILDRFDSNDRRHLSTESNVSSNLESILVLQANVASNLFFIDSNSSRIQSASNLMTATIDSNNERFDSNDLRVLNAERTIGSNIDSILVLESDIASNLRSIDRNRLMIFELRDDIEGVISSNSDSFDSALLVQEKNIASNLSFIESNLDRILALSNLLTATINSNDDRFDSNDFRVLNAERTIGSNIDSILVLEDDVASNLKSIITLEHNVASNLDFLQRNSNAISSNTDLIKEMRLDLERTIATNMDELEERFDRNDRRRLSTESDVSSNLDSILVLQENVAFNLSFIESNSFRIQAASNLMTATIDANNERFDSNDLRVLNAERTIGSNIDSMLVLEADVASNLVAIESNQELIRELRGDLESVMASNTTRFELNDERVSIAEDDIMTNTTFITTVRDDLTVSIENVRVNDATTTLAVGHSGTSGYTFSPQYTGENPTLSIVSGMTVAFNLAGISSHPFKIQDENGVDIEDGLLHVATDDTVSEGLDAQGKNSGILFWRVPEILAGIYAYQCASHPAMKGSIDVFRLVNNQLAIVANDTKKQEIVVALSGGLNHSLALDSGGNVYAWGANSTGQLGDGEGGFRLTSLVPIPVATFSDDPNVEIRVISAGAFHNLAIDSQGNVYAWGKNEYGRLGDGTTIDRDIPVLLSTFSEDPNINIIAVSAGWEFSLALDSSGRVYAWGRNNRGQLGDGTMIDRDRPVLLTRFSKDLNIIITAISAGYEHSLALDYMNNVYAWGYNLYGQLGDGTKLDRDTPVLVNTFTDDPNITITSISAGFEHSVALDSTGNVYAWGINNFGQLGDGAIVDDSVTPLIVSTFLDDPDITIEDISVGDNHNLALDAKGNIYAWGRNSIGQLGDQTTTHRNRPILLTTFSDDPNFTIISIAAGHNHSLTLSSNRTGYAWGDNNDGHLGDGTTTDNSTPQDIGRITTQKEDILALGNGNSLVFTTRDQDRLYISSHNGDVGIGTGNPIEKLHVEGGIFASGGITTQTNLRVEGGIQVVGTVRASADVRLDNNLDVRGAITAPSTSNIIPFYYPNIESFPDAATYHGAIAYAHDPGNMYYAHNGTWNKLANDGETNDISTGVRSIENIRINDISTTVRSVENIRINGAATTFSVGYSGASGYTFSPQYTIDNPVLSIVSGLTVAFNLAGISSHPFKIQDENGVDIEDGLLHVATDDTISTGLDAQGKDSGILFWRVPEALDGLYRYQCESHTDMTGNINIFRLVENQLASIATSSNNVLTIGNGDSLVLNTSNEDRLFISSDNGNVGIGTNEPIEKLHVVGSIFATAEINSQSDRRVKNNINQITSGLEKVKKLKGYTFTFNTDEKKKKRMGVIAQEVLQIIPEVVSHDEDNDRLSVAYGNIVGVLIEAIKDLSEEVDKLKKNKQDII